VRPCHQANAPHWRTYPKTMMRPVVRDGPRTDPLWLWPAGQVMPTGQVRQGKFREGKSPPAVFRFLEHDWHGRKPPALSPWIGPHRCQPNLQRSVLSMRSPPYEPSFAPATSKLGVPFVGDKTRDSARACCLSRHRQPGWGGPLACREHCLQPAGRATGDGHNSSDRARTSVGGVINPQWSGSRTVAARLHCGATRRAGGSVIVEKRGPDSAEAASGLYDVAHPPLCGYGDVRAWWRLGLLSRRRMSKVHAVASQPC
jgi:hypothetical protein